MEKVYIVKTEINFQTYEIQFKSYEIHFLTYVNQNLIYMKLIFRYMKLNLSFIKFNSGLLKLDFMIFKLNFIENKFNFKLGKKSTQLGKTPNVQAANEQNLQPNKKLLEFVLEEKMQAVEEMARINIEKAAIPSNLPNFTNRVEMYYSVATTRQKPLVDLP